MTAEAHPDGMLCDAARNIEHRVGARPDATRYRLMQPGDDMRITCAPAAVLLMGMSAGLATHLDATIPDPADDSIRQFLAQDDTQRPYRAMRRLEAENGTRAGWLEAATEYRLKPAFGIRSRRKEARTTSARKCCTQSSKANRKRLLAAR